MNRKMIVIGAGAALLLGSVALAQDYSGANKSSGTPAASSADQNASNTSATTPSSSAVNPSANSATGTDASATQQAGERG